MPQTAMERIIRARESRSVDHLAEQIEPLAQALAVLGQDSITAIKTLVKEAESQHKTLNDSIQASQEVLSSTVINLDMAAVRITSAAKHIIGIAVVTGLLVGMVSGIGSWVFLKKHYIKTESADAFLFSPGPLLVEPEPVAQENLILPLPLPLPPIDNSQKELIPKDTIVETKKFEIKKEPKINNN